MLTIIHSRYLLVKTPNLQHNNIYKHMREIYLNIRNLLIGSSFQRVNEGGYNIINLQIPNCQ